jgi:hypothetical protein
VEGGGDRLDRQVGQYLLAEKSGPGSVEAHGSKREPVRRSRTWKMDSTVMY